MDVDECEDSVPLTTDQWSVSGQRGFRRRSIYRVRVFVCRPSLASNVVTCRLLAESFVLCVSPFTILVAIQLIPMAAPFVHSHQKLVASCGRALGWL